MNFTFETVLPTNCLTMQECNTTIFNRAVSECSKAKFEYVWFFIIGFLFSNIGYLILDNRINLSPKLKTNLIIGFKIAGYVLSFIGLLMFIIGGYV